MNLTRSYPLTRFDASVVEDAMRAFASGEGDEVSSRMRVVKRGADRWDLDTDEEFLAEWRKGCDHAALLLHRGVERSLQVAIYGDDTEVSVSDPTRPGIERVMAVFDRSREASRVPEPPEPKPPPPTVFIGHGRDKAWRDLKDHLRDKQGYQIEAYEIGERAGHTIRDVLQSMLLTSSFALLVMTGEDEQASGEVRARQNVVHELGLFQGRLGFNRAIALLEEGTEDFSNLQGIHQIRFSAGNIRETFGDVLAALRREFG